MQRVPRKRDLMLIVCLMGLIGGRAALLSSSDSAIGGRVTGADGKPIVGALVGILDARTAAMTDAQTDSSGQFRVSGLDGEGTYRVVVSKYGYQQLAVDDVRPAQGELDLRLEKDPALNDPLPQPGNGPFPAVGNGPSPALPAEDDSQDPSFTLSVEVEEVILNITVEGKEGHRITDLKQEEFTVLQDGVIQQIRSFGHEDVPLSVVLLVDVSSSMEGSPMVEAKVAALSFLSQSRPRDTVSLVAFNDKVEIVRPFTQDMLQVRTGVHSLTPSGGTALYDALNRAVELVESAPHPRHAIVLLSDGKDEDSRLRFEAIDKRIQASDVVVYSIGEYAELDRKLFLTGKKYYKQPEYEVNLNPVWILRYLAELSGGRSFFPRLGEALEPFFTQIAEELHQQYVLTYQPSATEGQNGFHSIEVRINSPRYPAGLKVRTRKGYLDSARLK
ncbi:MAG: VWA domain-containing protein [Acidobacteriota bacterium]